MPKWSFWCAKLVIFVQTAFSIIIYYNWRRGKKREENWRLSKSNVLYLRQKQRGKSIFPSLFLHQLIIFRRTSPFVGPAFAKMLLQKAFSYKVSLRTWAPVIKTSLWSRLRSCDFCSCFHFCPGPLIEKTGPQHTKSLPRTFRQSTVKS